MLASKFIKIPLLADLSEMQALVADDFLIFEVGRLLENVELSKEEFLTRYQNYIENLKNGKKAAFPFSLIFTKKRETVEIKSIEQRFLVKPILPVIQLQPAFVRYSQKSFQTQVYGNECISWGVQFSYPFLFQDDKSFEIEKVRVCEKFPNTELFLKLQKWVRRHTEATPFLVENRRVNVPIRLGKACFSWIHRHPDLKEVTVVCTSR